LPTCLAGRPLTLCPLLCLAGRPLTLCPLLCLAGRPLTLCPLLCLAGRPLTLCPLLCLAGRPLASHPFPQPPEPAGYRRHLRRERGRSIDRQRGPPEGADPSPAPEAHKDRPALPRHPARARQRRRLLRKTEPPARHYREQPFGGIEDPSGHRQQPAACLPE